MHIIYSSKFARQYKKLAPDIKVLAQTKEQIFRIDQFDPRLKTHALSGRLDGLHAFSVTHSIRITFKKYNQVVVFFEIGPHNIYS
jgi:mRNA-degrading endonuclease YafQ of YafQ-DinJ toxin-antitoxin module